MSPARFSPTPARRRRLVGATLIILLAAVLRFNNLGHDSLWFDEALTSNTAAAGPAAALAVRDHVPLLYWLTGLSLRLLGDNEIALRLPSALAGVVAVAVLIAFGEIVAWDGFPRSDRPGTRDIIPRYIWAALLLAVSPLAIRHAQEARHYSLLLCFSLVSLYWLYRALDRRGLSRPLRSAGQAWLYFAIATVLNLLTHYSAWLWLVGQGAAVAIWLAWRGRDTWRATLRAAVPAALVIGVALLLLAGQAADAFHANTESAAGTTAAAPLLTWLRAIGLEFGFFSVWPAVVLALLAAGGGLLLARRRPLAALLLAVSGAVPVLLIQLLGITRFALPKYVIYLLPGYLIAAGVGIVYLLDRLPRARAGRLIGSAAAAGLVLAVALPAVGREYTLMIHDWRGAAAAVGGADVVLAVALDTGDGFNAAGVMAPVYLDPSVRLLDGNHLTAEDVRALNGQRGQVGALALNLYAPVTAGEGWVAANHQGSLYSLRRAAGDDDLAAQIAALYAELIPQAVPAAACDLALRLGEVQLARGDMAAVEAALAEPPDCPRNAERTRLQTEVAHRRLAEALAAGDAAEADRLAAALLAGNPGDEAALAVVTVADVLALFREGQVAVDAAGSPEPVEIRRFTMPSDGDTGEVLFVHPPAVVSFAVALPPVPTSLDFRVANDPQSWEWGGDGVTFVVTAQAAGEPARELYRAHAANDAAGRGFHPVELPLDEYAGQSVMITLSTEVGPAGDGTGDWAGWESPRIVRRGHADGR